MTPAEIGGLITAIALAVGALVLQFVNARNAVKKADQEASTTAKKSDLEALDLVIQSLRVQVDYFTGQVGALQTENNALHDTDNILRGELETFRKENQALRLKVDEQAKQIRELQNENALLRAENTSLAALTHDMSEKLDEYRSGKKKQTGKLGEANA